MPNPVWTGAVTFGLISIPVRLYPATEDHDLRFNLLHRHDNSRIVQKYYCPEDGEIVDWSSLVRGFEYSRGRYVVLDEADFAAVPLASLHAIEIEQFVPLSSVDPICFSRTYYLEPEELGLKPFALLSRVMEDSGLVAIGRLTLRAKEHVCIVRAYDCKRYMPCPFARETGTAKG